MFTTPCFIRKSTYKLINKLNKLGYRLWSVGLNEDLCIFTDHERGLYSVEPFSNIPHPEETDSIDCDTNEELFLAIAALRDDTDENQWFVYKDYWFICDVDNIEHERELSKESMQAAYFHYSHKATVEELIEHFRN